MRLLLDTHVLVWAFREPGKLTGRVVGAIEDPANELLVSAVSVYEIALKYRLGKLEVPRLVEDFDGYIAQLGATQLPVSVKHALLAVSIPSPHRDPFDRILAAQSIIEQVPIVTQDAALASFTVRTYW